MGSDALGTPIYQDLTVARYEILCFGMDYQDTDYCQCNTNQIDPEFYTLFSEAVPSQDREAAGMSSLVFGDDVYEDSFREYLVYCIYGVILLLGLALLVVFSACCYIMNRDKQNNNIVVDSDQVGVDAEAIPVEGTVIRDHHRYAIEVNAAPQTLVIESHIEG